jgi:hypothetical protein
MVAVRGKALERKGRRGGCESIYGAKPDSKCEEDKDKGSREYRCSVRERA